MIVIQMTFVAVSMLTVLAAAIYVLLVAPRKHFFKKRSLNKREIE